ncbi:MAG: calcium/sodium antiporter [Alphaproteobacteria bacterium]
MLYFFVVAGFVLLLGGGDALVRGAVALAERLGVSPLVIGLTIVAYGTSAPELFVSLDALLSGAPGITIGNAVGSNIANILLIIGCGALIAPMAYDRAAMRVDNTVMLTASAVLVLIGVAGTLTVWNGLSMLVLLCVYTLWQYRMHKRRPAKSASIAGATVSAGEVTGTLWRPAFTLICGLLGVAVGSHLLVTGAIGLARNFGVSEATIGLTLVALGTSLPELATTVVAAFRRHIGVALGNVVGSNIFNILGILGFVPLFGDVAIPRSIVAFDIWVMLGTSVIFVVWTTTRRTIGRSIGMVSILAYVAYLARHFYGVSP